MRHIPDLSPEERAILQSELTQVREQLGKLELQHATVHRAEDKSIVVDVQPFPELARAQHDGLMQTFATTLGEPRDKAFLSLAAKTIERELNDFGAAERSITISVRKPPPDAASEDRFSVANRYVTPYESGMRSRSFKDSDALEEFLGPLSGMLPPESRSED